MAREGARGSGRLPCPGPGFRVGWARPGSAGSGVSVGRGWLDGQSPGAVDAVESAAEEGAQVQRGGAALEPGVVLGGAAVAQRDPAPAAVGDLRDDALNVGSLLLIVRTQLRVAGPVGAGGAQQVVVVVQGDGASGLRSGAADAQRALSTPCTEDRGSEIG